MILTLVLTVYILLGLCAAALSWRNYRVWKFRDGIIDRMFELGDYSRRQKVFSTVSYDEMLFKFWKPLKPEVWYEDTSFLEPNHE
jgi:hypothetical protein